jgi:hypothetical protein
MELKLERESSIVAATPGVLYVDGMRECFTLEDPIREKRYDDGALVEVSAWKIQNQTAIPSGRYAVIIDYSQRFKRLMPHVLAVPGFSGIRIHFGNTTDDTDGCILVGSERQSQSVILYSRIAFEHLFTKMRRRREFGSR